jgi:hypothetical protein
MPRTYITAEVKSQVLKDFDAGMRPCQIREKYGFKNNNNVSRILEIRRQQLPSSTSPSMSTGLSKSASPSKSVRPPQPKERGITPNDAGMRTAEKYGLNNVEIPATSLSRLALSKPTKRKMILEDSERSLIKDLAQIAQDILAGTTPVSAYEWAIMEPYSQDIRELADPETSTSRKRRQLISNSSFLPALLYKRVHE